MIPASYYSIIYLILIAILSFAVFVSYSTYPQDRLRKENANRNVFPFLLILGIILFIGFRPVDKTSFVDMYDYNLKWQMLNGLSFEFQWDTDNIIFDNLYRYLACSGYSVYVLFVGAAAIYFLGIYFVNKKLFPNDILASILVYLAAFSTFSYATNGIKAGLAASLFLIALAFYHDKKWIGTIVFLILSYGFHHSMILPISAFAICYLIRNPKFFLAFWVFAFLMSMFHVTFFQTLFGSIADEQGAEYLLGSGTHVKTTMLGGFRIDFILYSSVPIIVGWVAVFKKKIRSAYYVFILNLYVLLNSIWLLCMYAEFTNRIAYLSWFLYPIVLIYPYLKEKWSRSQYSSFNVIALGHLGFTLFMNFIIYA